MTRKSTKQSGKAKAAQPLVSHLTPLGFLLVFEDIAGRVAIQHYANLIQRINPVLSEELAHLVEKAGSWGDQELEDALAPEED